MSQATLVTLLQFEAHAQTDATRMQACGHSSTDGRWVLCGLLMPAPKSQRGGPSHVKPRSPLLRWPLRHQAGCHGGRDGHRSVHLPIQGQIHCLTSCLSFVARFAGHSCFFAILKLHFQVDVLNLQWVHGSGGAVSAEISRWRVDLVRPSSHCRPPNQGVSD